jgi:hypothetical protein
MKEKRDRLFKRGRPVIRPLVILEDGKPHKDIGFMWASYKKGGFELFPKGMSEAEFLKFIIMFSDEVDMYIIDDFHKEYGGNMGPLCFISVKTIGQKIEPHSDVFPWATPRNIMRMTVALFQMIRYKKIGCSVTYALERSKPLFDTVCEYGVLKYVGKIPNGDPWGRGDEYVYTVRGKK